MGKEEHTTLDLGIEAPHGFRGWSGGNKDAFTISGSDATPSYLPGEIISGQWRLLIGVPNIRPKNTSSFEAGVYFVRHGTEPSGLTDVPLRREAQWYRGDFHMHSGHSDGRCASQTGHDVPCPIFVTAEGAVRRGLDFIAVTDHNTISQYDSLRELQPYFDRMLLIPGREITTFHGHANLFGATDFVDFLIGRNAVPDMTTMLRMAQEAGGVISINHPNAPSGEICMGCGWDSSAPMDWNMISAIEAVYGGAPCVGFLVSLSVANHFGLAPNHVSRLFRREGQTRFSDYLNLVRMNRAKFMLHNYRLTVKEVAANSGYSDVAYFCRIFKKMNNETPRQYHAMDSGGPR